MNQEHYKRLETSMRTTIIPEVKKFIRLTIKENAGKEKDYQHNLAALLEELESQYTNQSKIIFKEMREEMLLSGIVSYSEYIAPKDEDL